MNKMDIETFKRMFRTLDDADVKGKRVMVRLNTAMRAALANMKDGEIISCLENTLFHADEEKNDYTVGIIKYDPITSNKYLTFDVCSIT